MNVIMHGHFVNLTPHYESIIFSCHQHLHFPSCAKWKVWFLLWHFEEMDRGGANLPGSNLVSSLKSLVHWKWGEGEKRWKVMVRLYVGGLELALSKARDGGGGGHFWGGEEGGGVGWCDGAVERGKAWEAESRSSPRFYPPPGATTHQVQQLPTTTWCNCPPPGTTGTTETTCFNVQHWCTANQIVMHHRGKKANPTFVIRWNRSYWTPWSIFRREQTTFCDLPHNVGVSRQ